MTDSLIHTALQLGIANTLVAGAIAALALLATRLRLGANLAHGLWVLALLKLLTPPLFEVEVPVGLPAIAVQRPAVSAPSPAVPERSTVRVLDDRDLVRLEEMLLSGDTGVPDPLPEDLGAADPGPEPAEERVAVTAATSFDWAAWLGASWIAGAAGLLLLSLLRAARFHRQLRFARRADRSLRTELAELARRMGVRRVPEVLVMPGRLSPMLWGLFGPARIILPEFLAERLSVEQRRTLLAHELAHFHRRDHWVRVLELCAHAIYWWNPLVWWASVRLRKVEEECCDAWVLRTLPDSSRSYADALIDTIEYLSDAPRSLPAPASGVGHVTDLKNRLRNIMIDHHPHTLSRWSRATVLLLAAVTLPLVPATGQENKRRAAEEARVEAEMQARRAEMQARRAAEQARAAAERARRMVEVEVRDVDRRRARDTRPEGEQQRMLRALKRAMDLLNKSDHAEDAEILARLAEGLGNDRRNRGHVDRRARALDDARRLQLALREREAAHRESSRERAVLEVKLNELEKDRGTARRRGDLQRARDLGATMNAMRRELVMLRERTDQLAKTRLDLEADRRLAEARNLVEGSRSVQARIPRREADRVRRLEQQVAHLTEMVKKLVDQRSHRELRDREEEEEIEEVEEVEEVERTEKAERKAAKKEAKNKDKKARRESRTRGR